MNDILLCLGKGNGLVEKQTLEELPFILWKRTFCAINPYISEAVDETAFEPFETIDEFLTILDGRGPRWKITDCDGWKKEYSQDLIDQMIKSVNINECCALMRRFVESKFKGVVILSPDDTAYLLENGKEFVKELLHVNDIAKENNVKFVMF